jgi:choice-of-anchor C domain-containing protein
MKIDRTLCVVTTALTLCAVGSAHANLISNGSFEDPGIGLWYQNYGVNTGDPNYAGATIPGWSISPNNVDIVSDKFSGAPAYDGHQYLDLVGTGSTGGISQSFDTVLGQQYTLSFAYGNNPWSTTTASGLIDVVVSSLLNPIPITHDTSTTSNINWTLTSITFTGTGNPSILSFLNTVGGNNGGILLDDISVTATPIPPALALFGGGLGLISLVARRKRRRQSGSRLSFQP